MAKLAPVIVGFAVVVLLIAFGIMPAITATQTDASERFTVDAEATVTLTEGLELTATETRTESAHVSLMDTESNEGITRNISEGSTAEYDLSGGTSNVTLNETTTDNITVTAEYPRTFGMSDGAKTIVANLDIILALVAILLIMGGLVLVVSE